MLLRGRGFLPGLKTSDGGAAEPHIQSPGLLLNTLLPPGLPDLVEEIFGVASWKASQPEEGAAARGSAAAWSLEEEPGFPVRRPGLPSL